jgi:cytochrome c oxidase subunit 2
MLALFRLPWTFFQDSATPIMEGIINLHNYIFAFLCLIFLFVVVMLYNIVEVFYRFIFKPNSIKMLRFRYIVFSNLALKHGKFLEIVWTLFPAIVLVLIALPSFFLLYAMDEIIYPALTLKIIGHQWYWSYHYLLNEYEDLNLLLLNTFQHYSFDSNLLTESDLANGDLRLLEVDNVVLLPTNLHVRILLTANDVLHSWAVPSLGVKMDAVPGRINQFPVFLKREGVFYGQCSELCGPSHGFMPICLVVCSPEDYLGLLGNKVQEELLSTVNFLNTFESNYIIYLSTLANSLLFLSFSKAN